ncbi:MAG: SOS response-associated peptidase, partial [Acidimicrobiales bacterium]
GFYEWERPPGGGRRPWHIRRSDGAPMVFAGLWEAWFDPAAGAGAEPLRTCAIVTTAANEVVAPVHDRMPVVLAPSDWEAWVDGANRDPRSLSHLLVAADPRAFEAYPVRSLVNSVRNNGPGLLVPAD